MKIKAFYAAQCFSNKNEFKINQFVCVRVKIIRVNLGY